MKWTEKQQQVIDSRNRNLLVSAAAGSGKTAVLVERIISMISEGTHPLNIDQLLVMTFTNAAASEMRERIGAAVEKKLKEDPGNEHLWLQSALIPQAKIMTIDSFCLDLIRNHYNALDIDPAFRIGDEGELTLLKGDVMEQVLEECYETADDGFLQFSEQFGSGKSDKAMEDVILQAWTFSQSHPWPNQWLDQSSGSGVFCIFCKSCATSSPSITFPYSLNSFSFTLIISIVSPFQINISVKYNIDIGC